MLRISTFNIQNDFSNYSKAKTVDIVNYLTKNKIDILGLQEVFSKCNKDLEKELENCNYNISGKYRFYLHFLLKRFNEKVPVVTNKEIIESKTYHLPAFPSPLKRIVTKTVILYNGKLISIYNTHLDFMLDSVKKRELRKLLKLIQKDDNLIVLLGDFNLKNNNKLFIDFFKALEESNIYRVDVGEKTLKVSKSKRAIDHIFLSQEFKLKKMEVIKNVEISDHYPILIEVDI